MVGCSDPDIFCITNCANFPTLCNDLTCPYGYNTCTDLQPTCFTPLACPECWGLDGIVQTNIAFAVAAIVLVAILTFTKWDIIKTPPDGEVAVNAEPVVVPDEDPAKCVSIN